MKKLSLLLCVLVNTPLFCYVDNDAYDSNSVASDNYARRGTVTQSASNLVERAVDAIKAPFEGWSNGQDADSVYKQEVEKAKQKRDNARQQRRERGERINWFQDHPEDVVYKKEVRQAKEKRDQKKRERKGKQKAADARDNRKLNQAQNRERNVR